MPGPSLSSSVISYEEALDICIIEREDGVGKTRGLGLRNNDAPHFSLKRETLITIGFTCFFTAYRLFDLNQLQGEQGALLSVDFLSPWIDILVSHPLIGAGILLLFIPQRASDFAMRASIVVIAAGMVSIGISSLVPAWSLGAMLAGSFLAGVGISGAFSGWLRRASSFPLGSAVKMIVTASVGSAFVRAIVYLVGIPWLHLAVLLGSLILQWLLYKGTAEANRPRTCNNSTEAPCETIREESRSIVAMVKMMHADYAKPIFCIFVISIALASIQPLASMSLPERQTLLAVHFAGIAAGSFVLLIAWNRLEVLFSSSNRLTAGLCLLMVVGFSLLPFADDSYHVFLIATMSALYAAMMIVLLSTVVEITREHAAWCMPATSILLFIMWVSSALGSVIGLSSQNTRFEMPLLIIAITATLLLIMQMCERQNDPNLGETKAEGEIAVLVELTEDAIRNSPILRNRFRLSEREIDVLVLMLSSRTVPGIARSLVISENTVKTHTRRIYQKLAVHSKEALSNLVLEVLQEEASE